MKISGKYPWGEQYVEADLRYLSLGAGVQSTAVLYMILNGEIDDPPTCAIFSDTGWEPRDVYEHLERCIKDAGSFPIHVVTAGNIREQSLASRTDNGFASIPYFVTNEDGNVGMLRRQCTREFKIAPITKEVRRLLGLKAGARAAGNVIAEGWQGISWDELQRMRESRESWIWHRYPLIERRMTRNDCATWLSDRKIAVPSKSACLGCPYHDDGYWRALRDTSPDEWQDVVEFDRAIRSAKLRTVNAEPYVHRSMRPLDEVEFKADTQGNLFGFANECEGMCGV